MPRRAFPTRGHLPGIASGGRVLPIAGNGVASAIRAGDLGDFKLLPIMTTFTATVVMLGVPIVSTLPAAALLLLSLGIGAAFASLINDLFDMEDDRLAGKPNVAMRYSRRAVALSLPPLLGAGCLVVWWWRADPLLVASYAAAWIAFVAYSVPPLRLKTRGGWGVVAMGLGEAALPALVAMLLCGHATGTAIPPLWILAVAVWTLSHGMRAILWHQLVDAEADALAWVDTLVRRCGAAWVRRLAARWLFPAELAGLATMLVMIHSIVPWLALAFYAVTVWRRVQLGFNVAVIVAPVRKQLVVVQDFYLAFLPLAIVAAAVARHPWDIAVLPVFLLLFPRAILRIAADTLWLIRQAAASRV